MRGATAAWLLFWALCPCTAWAQAQTADAQLIARGAYLAKAGDCAGCHTAPAGGAPYAGGLAMGSPFGTIISTNITPDPTVGIGRYSFADFARAVREGVTPAGKHLYPAMPYTAFAKITDDDMRALYAYMMHGVAPVAHAAPPTRLPFPFNQRWALKFWKMLFLPHGPYQPRPTRDASWNRGAYLVQSLGHCGSCHTPRGSAYEEKGHDETDSQFLAGAVNDHWFATNLTGDMGSGLGRVNEEELVQFMKTGHGGGLVAYGSMVQTIEDSLQYLTDDDLRAISRYLKSLPPRHGSGNFIPGRQEPESAAGANRTRDVEYPGHAVYATFCAQCHQADGSGVPLVFPKLVGNPSMLNEDTTSLIRLLIEGGNSPHTLTGPPRQQMPDFAHRLTDIEIAQVLTYIRTSWGNDAGPVTTNDVATLREEIHK